MRPGVMFTFLFTGLAAALIAAPADSLEFPQIELDSSAIADTVGSPDSLPAIQKMPEITKFVEAVYSPATVKKGIQGTVLMDLLVSDSGTVDSVAVVGKLHPALDSAAVAAARKFRFSPAIIDSQPASVVLQYAYRFTLDEVAVAKDTVVNLSGRLLERGTKKPIADAMVVVNFVDTLSDTTLKVPFSVYRERIGKIPGQFLEEDRLVALTDSLGQFRFRNLPACSVEISAPLPGYEEFRTREKIARGEAVEGTFYVRRVSYSDYEIVAYGKVEEKEVSRRQITLNEIKKIPGLGGDAVKVVQAMPGVARPTFGSGQIVVRGAPTWDSQFYLDGVLIPQLYHFGGIKSTYNSDALEAVDFYPGGWGTRYGGGTAGVIELTGRKAKNDRWQGYIDPNLYDGTIMLEGPVTRKLSVLGSARMSFAGFLLKWVLDNTDLNIPITVQPYYWDYLVRADYEHSKDNTAFLTAFGSGDRMDLIVRGFPGGSKEIDDARDRAKLRITFNMGLAGWDARVNDRVKNSLRLSFTKASSFTSIFGFAKWTEDTYMYHLRDQVTTALNPRLKLNIGADVSVMDENLIMVLPSGSGAIVRDTSQNWIFGDLGAYANLEWKPADRVQIIPGLRYDYFPELDYNGSWLPAYWHYDLNNTTRFSGEPSFRLNGRYEFVDRHAIKAAVGNYSQTPQPIGQVIHKQFGNPHMPATKASHTVLGYEWRITDLIHLDAQAYYNYQWDIPRFPSTGADIAAGDATNRWVHDAEGRMYGLELMLKHDDSERFFGWVSYTLARAQRRNPREPDWYLYGQDETNNLQVLGSWHLRRDWDLGFRARYVTGKPDTPIDSVYYNEDYQAYLTIDGKPNSIRQKPFFQLDLRVDKKFVFDRRILSIYLDLQNVSYFLYKSPEFTIYNYDYTESQSASMIFFPAIGLRLDF